MSVLISVPISMAISQYSNLNHACESEKRLFRTWKKSLIFQGKINRYGIACARTILPFVLSFNIQRYFCSPAKEQYFKFCCGKKVHFQDEVINFEINFF